MTWLVRLVILSHVTAAIDSPLRCLLNYSSIAYTDTDSSNPYGVALNTVGNGATGTVTVFQRQTRHVAVKAFAQPAFHYNNSICKVDSQQEREVKLEYHIGQILSDITGVAKTYDLLYNTSSCQWGLSMELVPKSLVRTYRALTILERIAILMKLESTLVQIHSLGISHGDIKLENVLLDTDMEPRLIDFGAATFAGCPVELPYDENGSVISNVIPGDYGTLAFLPPETFSVLEFDRQKGDLWALGILSFVLFTGKSPWTMASESDYEWRRFMGWEVDEVQGSQQCCMTKSWLMRESALNWPSCPSGKGLLLSRLPNDVRGTVDRWLETNVRHRSFSKRV